MSIKAVDHYNITAPARVLVQTRQFYQNILGLQDGFRPQFGAPGYWLYADDKPIVHLTESQKDTNAKPNYLGHVALQCVGLSEVKNHLNNCEVPFREFVIEELGQTQLFVKDPAGISVELNFQETDT
jgi:catechol 2,3-dioxygenase-like lactoylglutathione lyase family enzyme